MIILYVPIQNVPLLYKLQEVYKTNKYNSF
jgi:hypothetical protein